MSEFALTAVHWEECLERTKIDVVGCREKKALRSSRSPVFLETVSHLITAFDLDLDDLNSAF